MAFIMSKNAARDGNFASYRVWHTLWHLAAPAAIAVVLWRYCRDGEGRAETLPGHCML